MAVRADDDKQSLHDQNLADQDLTRTPPNPRSLHDLTRASFVESDRQHRPMVPGVRCIP